jgi:hypothetical protein
MKRAITILLTAVYLCGYSQVSRFYKDGQWWVSWDRKDANVQVFRPAKEDVINSKWVNPLDTMFYVLSTSTLTVPTVEQYRAKCHGHTFSLITDSIYNASSNSYVISFNDGTHVESGVQCYNSSNEYIPTPPFSTDRLFFTKHLMFRLMAACYDDKWLYCPCGAKFPLVKK